MKRLLTILLLAGFLAGCGKEEKEALPTLVPTIVPTPALPTWEPAASSTTKEEWVKASKWVSNMMAVSSDEDIRRLFAQNSSEFAYLARLAQSGTMIPRRDPYTAMAIGKSVFSEWTGEPADFEVADRWFRLAIRGGEKCEFCDYWWEGVGVKKDPAFSLECFKLQKDVKWVGFMISQGIGTKADPELAIKTIETYGYDIKEDPIGLVSIIKRGGSSYYTKDHLTYGPMCANPEWFMDDHGRSGGAQNKKILTAHSDIRLRELVRKHGLEILSALTRHRKEYLSYYEWLEYAEGYRTGELNGSMYRQMLGSTISSLPEEYSKYMESLMDYVPKKGDLGADYFKENEKTYLDTMKTLAEGIKNQDPDERAMEVNSGRRTLYSDYPKGMKENRRRFLEYRKRKPNLDDRGWGEVYFVWRHSKTPGK